jgi:hypothetical protein
MMERKIHAASPAPRPSARNDTRERLPAQSPVPAPWALRAIGRRGVLMRHAALQTQAIAAGATLDTRRLPSAKPTTSALPRAVELHLEELGRSSIIVEN